MVDNKCVDCDTRDSATPKSFVKIAYNCNADQTEITKCAEYFDLNAGCKKCVEGYGLNTDGTACEACDTSGANKNYIDQKDFKCKQVTPEITGCEEYSDTEPKCLKCSDGKVPNPDQSGDCVDFTFTASDCTSNYATEEICS